MPVHASEKAPAAPGIGGDGAAETGDAKSAWFKDGESNVLNVVVM